MQLLRCTCALPLQKLAGVNSTWACRRKITTSDNRRFGKRPRSEFNAIPISKRFVKMRPLTDDETKMVFSKLERFIGTDGIAKLVDRKDVPHVFRLHLSRVYYLSEVQVREITNFSRDRLISTGICVGKLTHSGKFRVTIHFLEVLAQFAKHKVWLKPSAEMSYLYGHHVTKVGLAKVTEGIPQYAGVVVYSEMQIPLGFGVAAQSADSIQSLEPTAIVVLNCTSFDLLVIPVLTITTDADNGQWLRSESELS